MFIEFGDQAPAAHLPAKPVSGDFFDQGIACSSSGDGMDFLEAHKWFNLAALAGDSRGAAARASIALDMTLREIAEAQRRARVFLRRTSH